MEFIAKEDSDKMKILKDKEFLHSLVNEYHQKTGNFKPFYLHQEIDEGTQIILSSVFNNFLDYALSKKVEK
jgi:hypothetical protein